MPRPGAGAILSWMHSRPILVINPPGDQAFEDFATANLDAGTSIAAFQDALRTRYPRARVHRRELAAERQVVWYVYRDGHWIANRRPEGGTDDV